MGEKTAISWCDHTFNPWLGCVEVSPACAHCYAKRDAERFFPGLWGHDAPRRITSDANWRKPLQWQRQAAADSVRAHRLVFSGSMCDVFEERPALAEPRQRLWRLIRRTPNLVWLLLTKRPQNIAAMLPDDWGREGWPNVWLGTTAETQEWADKRIPHLLDVPARLHFLSVEPMLGPVDLLSVADDGAGYLDALAGISFSQRRCQGSRTHQVGWVIAGGESGPQARPTRAEWVRELREQCWESAVPFHFKQWGEWIPQDQFSIAELKDPKLQEITFKKGQQEADGTVFFNLGKHRSGHLLDGREYREIPDVR